MVYQPRGNGVAQDAVILGSSRALSHSHTAVLFDGLETKSAVGAGAGEEDTHGVLALVCGQRTEETIDGRTARVGLNGWGHHVQHPAVDGQGGVRWDSVDVVGRDRRLIL